MASTRWEAVSPVNTGRCELATRLRAVRLATIQLVRSLEPDDLGLQSAPFASPAKWHLAHTSWFFEQFVLGRDARYCQFDARYPALFNSYYRTVGDSVARAKRGLLSRPTMRTIRSYRVHVEASLIELLERDRSTETEQLVTLGLHHEQQHQELILTDLKHAFAQNPLRPAVLALAAPDRRRAPELEWIVERSPATRVGADGRGFAFDHEGPRHAALLAPYRMANRLVTNGEFVEFVRDGGYRDPRLWVADGWDWVQANGIDRPLYWEPALDAVFTLGGLRDLDPDEPACHVSWFEADAYARWAKARLPTEYEWETLAARLPVTGNLLESGHFHPRAALPPAPGVAAQMFGDVWEWTSSPFMAYPGYRPPAGALGEYNAKFMCSQFVCRGGSCVTPRDEARATGRNFFYPGDRWQFLGVRLAQDAHQ